MVLIEDRGLRLPATRRKISKPEYERISVKHVLRYGLTAHRKASVRARKKLSFTNEGGEGMIRE